MEKKVVCNISEEDRDNIEENLSMLNAIEKLVMIIANNNSILKEESILYNRLIEDFRKYRKDVDSFWNHYLKIYEDQMDEDTQLTLDYVTCEMSIMPIQCTHKAIIK